MNVRDRALVGVLSVALVVLSAVVLAPSLGDIGGEVTPPPSAPSSATYVEGVVGAATNASPFGARTAADRQLVSLLFRGLVRLGPGGAILPDLAESWDVDPSGETWTFHLRADQRWQDGVPITAADVVFTISRLADPTYAGPGAGSWGEVGAAAPDASTVILSLATPLGGFLQAATQPIAPVHLLGAVPTDQLPDDPFGRAPVGSGYFRLTELTNAHAVLVAVTGPSAPDVPGDAAPAGPTDSLATITPATRTLVPYLSGIEFRFYPDDARLLSAWQDGRLDGASGLSPAAAASLAAPGVSILRYPSATLLGAIIDLRAGSSPLPSAAIRTALLSAIDRPSIVRTVLAGFGEVADGPVPTWSPMFSADSTSAPVYSPSGAIAALEAAGWKRSSGTWLPKGSKEPFAIEVLSPDQTVNPVAWAVAEAVVRDWRTIGIDATHAVPEATETLGDRLRAGAFQVAVVPVAVGLDPDLYPLFASTQVKAGGSNLSGLQDTSLDALLKAARKPGADAARMAAYAALERRLSDQQYLLPIAFRDEVVVVRDTLSGLAVRPVGAPGDRFWDVLTWRLAAGR
jgi:peptide/nickel transport system substrate-binding protein